MATTHKYIRILLASDRIKTHTSERSLLKNLGTWCALSPPASPQAGCQGQQIMSYPATLSDGSLKHVHDFAKPVW